MKILIVNSHGRGELITPEILPRIGDKVDMFYRPFPVVNDVLLYPSKKLLSEIYCQLGSDINVDAIVTVE